MLLSEAIEALAIATQVDGRSPATVNSYRRKLKPLVAFLGDIPIKEITANDLRRYVVDLENRSTRWADHPGHDETEGGLSEFTIAGHIRAFKRLFNFLEEEDEIKVNPARRIKARNPRPAEPKGISQEDFSALLKTTNKGTVADLRDRAIMLFLFDTACRVAGLCGLRVQDVDFNEMCAPVTEKWNKTRQVPFNPPTAQALRDWLEVRPEGHGDWMFISLGNKAKGQLTRSGVIQMLKRRAKRAGVTGPVNPHSFRHGFARDFLLAGGTLAVLADLMGHETVETTKRWYGIFESRQLQEKHRQLSPVARMFGGGKNGGS
jgi:site-specific recombinase XerD